jgi:hypothetical protein
MAKPNIVFHPSRRSVTANLANGQRFHYIAEHGEDYIEVETDSEDLRAELLRQGGVEDTKRTWYLSRDIPSVTIPQWGGFAHHHKASRGGLRTCDGKNCTDETCEHSITCGSPECQRFFTEEWQRANPTGPAGRPRHFYKGLRVAPAIAGPSPKDRPMSQADYAAEMEREDAESPAVASARAFAEALIQGGATIAAAPPRVKR